MKKVKAPISNRTIEDLEIGDRVSIHGKIFTGRDAALPKLVRAIREGRQILDLGGSVIMHTAVSNAGIAPTTSNKEEIEGSIPHLAKFGVKIHIGKGVLNKNTIEALNREKSIFLVTPPAAALLTSKIISKKVAAFEEEGIEAIYQLKVDGIPGIVAVVHGESLY